jgi:ComF family protein
MRQAVLQFKYQGVSALAEELAPLVNEHLRAHPTDFDLIAPVPLAADRLRQRGYNQSQVLAESLAPLTGATIAAGALRRTRGTQPQARLSGWEERHRNVDGAFEADPAVVSGRRVLVLDDVCTTGATLEACGQALRAAGARPSWGFALAREI